jgi:hypothetical protein
VSEFFDMTGVPSIWQKDIEEALFSMQAHDVDTWQELEAASRKYDLPLALILYTAVAPSLKRFAHLDEDSEEFVQFRESVRARTRREFNSLVGDIDVGDL